MGKLLLMPWTFLVGFLSQSMPSTTLSSAPGSPLTEEEYKVFFSSLKPTWKASIACQIRRSKGCNDPKIMQLDQYENHGQIPKGPICANLPQTEPFETFCVFAQFRCLNQKFYTERIPCPQLSRVEETGASAETPRSFHPLEAASSQGDAKLLSEASPSLPDTRLHANIDTILKYSFAVSGQEPVPRGHLLALPSSTWGALQEQPGPSKAGLVTTPAETSSPDTRETGATGQRLLHSIHRLISTAFSLEYPQDVAHTRAHPSGEAAPSDQEANPAAAQSKGSLLTLEKDEALVILCYAVLQDICISSAVSKVWKRLEARSFGFGDSVCDSLGRRHTALCPECAFCSLKTEQCQAASDLKRVRCDGGGTFTVYINPGVLAQYHTIGTKIGSPGVEEYPGMEMYGGLRAEYWCGRLATHGCDDSRVAVWLQTEYSFFPEGDFPGKICDSKGVQHPNYCAFKSHQCLQFSLRGQKVLRRSCHTNETYHVLSSEEGEEEVLLWSKKFLSFAEG